VVTFTHGDVAMVGNYPKDIRARINAKGGYKKMPVDGLWALPAPDLWIGLLTSVMSSGAGATPASSAHAFGGLRQGKPRRCSGDRG
jgi:hypothetical protein